MLRWSGTEPAASPRRAGREILTTVPALGVCTQRCLGSQRSENEDSGGPEARRDERQCQQGSLRSPRSHLLTSPSFLPARPLECSADLLFCLPLGPLCQGSSEKQPTGDLSVYLSIERFFYKGLTQGMVESRSLPPAGWGPRKDNGVSSSPRTKDPCPSSNTHTHTHTHTHRHTEFFLLQPLTLLGIYKDWMGPAHIREGDPLCSICLFTGSSHPATPSEAHENNLEPNIWAPGGLVKLTHRVNCHHGLLGPSRHLWATARFLPWVSLSF